MPKDHDKCPTCGCTETYRDTFLHDQGFTEEVIEKCKNCGRLKHHWAYGCLYVVDWKDAFKVPFGYKIKSFLKKLGRLFKKKQSKKDYDALPF